MKEAPTFYKVLKSIAMHPTISGNQRKKQLLKPIVGCAGAVLLKGRNSRLSAVQHLITKQIETVSLFLGQTRKKTLNTVLQEDPSSSGAHADESILEVAEEIEENLPRLQPYGRWEL
ncbi:unnamed protein product [Porites lobata]|uniref:Uncharacterized protein n=1 Tax=Porites lobata TaxID=104759 RepID=A0ABN8NAN1_9CNID|nr:unnamed protein product [Porites lobata]